jgi:ketosteroid isomerase-like protein
VPAGTFTGPHYHIVEKTAEGERTLDYWFASDLPGPPIRSESRLDGRKIQTVELVARGWDDPRATAATVWWSGDWSRIGGKGSEHWHALDGALHGVALSPGGFEVMWVDEAPLGTDNQRRLPTLFAMPGGRSAVRFAIEDRDPPGLAFANAAHDYPTAIRYAPEPGEGLLAALEGRNGDPPRTHRFRRGPAVDDPELLAADRAFFADSREKGARGWASHFAKDGAMVDAELARIAGRAAIEAHMTPILESSELSWSPVLSRRAGSLGFTLGRFGARPRAVDGAAVSGTYVTVWRRTGKRWQVVFDAGRPRG